MNKCNETGQNGSKYLCKTDLNVQSLSARLVAKYVFQNIFDIQYTSVVKKSQAKSLNTKKFRFKVFWNNNLLLLKTFLWLNKPSWNLSV